MSDEQTTTPPTASDSSGGPRILVPLDGSDEARSALPYAATLSSPNGTITLLTVVPREGAGDEQGAETGRHAALDIAAAELRAAGHTVETRVLTGDPAQRIVEAAADGGADMIVMGTHGRGALGRLLHGSVADQVAHEATAPVMVVRGRETGPGPVGILRLVVPLDGTPLAEESLPVAIAISRRLGTPLFLVLAVDLADIMPPAVGMGEAIPFELYDQTEEEMEKEAGAYLDGIAAKLRAEGLPVVTRVLNGPPAVAIGEVTQLGDVIVLCSHERSGVLRWLVGSVAERLIHDDNAPVILVPATEAATEA